MGIGVPYQEHPWLPESVPSIQPCWRWEISVSPTDTARRNELPGCRSPSLAQISYQVPSVAWEQLFGI